MAQYKMHLLVCGGTGCRASQSEKIAGNLKEEIKNLGLENEAQVVITGCFCCLSKLFSKPDCCGALSVDRLQGDFMIVP